MATSRKKAAKKSVKKASAKPRPKPRMGDSARDDGRVRVRSGPMPLTGSPGPVVVPRERVGAAVQALVTFNGASRVDVVQEGPDSYRVSALA